MKTLTAVLAMSLILFGCKDQDNTQYMPEPKKDGSAKLIGDDVNNGSEVENTPEIPDNSGQVEVEEPSSPTIQECIEKHDIDLGEVPAHHIDFSKNIVVVVGDNVFSVRNCDAMLIVDGPVSYSHSGDLTDGLFAACSAPEVTDHHPRTRFVGNIEANIEWTLAHIKMKNPEPREFSIGKITRKFEDIKNLTYLGTIEDGSFAHRIHGAMDGYLGKIESCEWRDLLESLEENRVEKLEAKTIERFKIKHNSRNVRTYSEIRSEIEEMGQ